jgi:hypothetical protein
LGRNSVFEPANLRARADEIGENETAKLNPRRADHPMALAEPERLAPTGRHCGAVPRNAGNLIEDSD